MNIQSGSGGRGGGHIDGGKKFADALRTTTDNGMRELGEHHRTVHPIDFRILVYSARNWPTTVIVAGLLAIVFWETQFPRSFDASSLWARIVGWGWVGLVVFVAAFAAYPYLAPVSKRPPYPSVFFSFATLIFATGLRAQNTGVFVPFLGTAIVGFVTLILARSIRAKRLFDQEEDDENNRGPRFVVGDGLKAWAISLGASFVFVVGLYFVDAPYRDIERKAAMARSEHAKAKEEIAKKSVMQASLYLESNPAGWIVASVPSGGEDSALVARGKIEATSPEQAEFLRIHGSERFAMAYGLVGIAFKLRALAGAPIRVYAAVSKPADLEIIWKAAAEMGIDLIPMPFTAPRNIGDLRGSPESFAASDAKLASILTPISKGKTK